MSLDGEFLIEENRIPMCGDTVYMTLNYKNVQGLQGQTFNHFPLLNTILERGNPFCKDICLLICPCYV